jgi:hypothetical protein
MSSKSEKQLEKYELPSTVDGICALIRHILDGGHVCRVELDNDDAYVRAWRWVERNDLAEPDVNWDGALRNVEMMEYSSAQASPFQVLVDMMLLATDRGYKCTVWAVGTGGSALLKGWLALRSRNMPVGIPSFLLGLPVMELRSIPAETLILCCSKFPNADPSEVSFTIKATIEVRTSDEPDNYSAGGSGDHPEEYVAAARQLAPGAGGLRTVPWKTTCRS